MKKPLLLATAFLLLAGSNALQAAGPEAQWLGVLWTKGGVSVGNAKATSGTTVLPGDVITTAQESTAWVRFRTPASTILLGDTQVVLLASESAPNFLLRRGRVVVSDKLADPVQVDVPGGFILVSGDPQLGAECEMATVDDASTISVKRGMAEIHGQGAPIFLHSGQSARVEAGPQGGQQVAGKINKVIPQGKIKREGAIEELPLALNQVINWNDLVRTLQAGRAQITLLDGTTLNVGARSEIKVLKHDPHAQQTEIEVTLGRVEANVTQITAPGGKFELRTKSAVIGTIDTSFVAESDDKSTRVCGVKGTTSVKSSDPNINKTVKLHRKECTTVVFGGPPTDPVFSPAEMANMLNQTALNGAGAGAGGAGGLAVGATHIPWVFVGIASGAAVGAGVAGVVLANGGTTSPTTP